jgi:hypothetical protein
MEMCSQFAHEHRRLSYRVSMPAYGSHWMVFCKTKPAVQWSGLIHSVDAVGQSLDSPRQAGTEFGGCYSFTRMAGVGSAVRIS